MKMFHIDKLNQLFPDFEFGDVDEDGDYFLDTSQVAYDLVQPSYYFHFISLIFLTLLLSHLLHFLN